MLWRRTLIALLVASAFVAAGAAVCGDVPQRTVVVLLFDGFAPAMLTGNATPAIDRMRREGAWTHHFVPPFPSISLVSGVTISTGCWPEHHGIISNVFLDPQRGRYDHSRDADWLIGCEHMHQAAERQGVRAAALDWYGAESSTKGKQATYVTNRRWKEMPDDLAKADEVIDLLRLPEGERPRLILAYFRGPDDEAHYNGMDGEKTRAAVVRSDAAVAKVMRAIETAPFPVALFVTTDHGMRPVSTIVNIHRILAHHDIGAEALSSGTTAFLYVRDPSQVARAHEILAKYEQFDVLSKEAQPPYSHLGIGPRVPSLIISAHPPYFIEDPGRWPWFLAWLKDYGPELMWAGVVLKASHGYPPAQEGMAGILYAWGSGIAPGKEVAAADAIDLHPTVLRLLDLQPGSPVDGKVAAEFLDP